MTNTHIQHASQQRFLNGSLTSRLSVFGFLQVTFLAFTLLPLPTIAGVAYDFEEEGTGIILATIELNDPSPWYHFDIESLIFTADGIARFGLPAVYPGSYFNQSNAQGWVPDGDRGLREGPPTIGSSMLIAAIEDTNPPLSSLLPPDTEMKEFYMSATLTAGHDALILSYYLPGNPGAVPDDIQAFGDWKRIPTAFDTFQGSKTTVKITPNGCKNEKLDVPQSQIIYREGFTPFAGCWLLSGAGFDFDEEEEIGGLYIERKIGKDYTQSLSGFSLADVIDDMGDWLDSQNCGFMTDAQILGCAVTKGQSIFSKSGDRTNIDLRVECEYTTDNDKTKKIKAKIKGKMDRVENGVDPGFDCGITDGEIF